MRIIVIGSKEDWCYYSWKKYIDNNVIYYDNFQILFRNYFLNKLFRYVFAIRKRKKIFELAKKVFYKKIEKKMKITNEKTIIIFYDWNNLACDLNFVYHIKHKYTNIVTCYMFTNIVKKSCAQKYDYLSKIAHIYDNVIAFDENDAQKYDFKYHNLIFNYGKLESNSFLYDLCFCGQAKSISRLNLIHSIYNKAKKENLSCAFYIVGVDDEHQISDSDIIYNNKITYTELLNIISKSKSIVDVIQDESIGIPLNIVEAIYFNKKLITTSKNIENTIFYDSNNILVYDENIELKKFLDTPIKKIDNLNIYFSLENLLKVLEK